jgi:iron only hydrogenase large subunit-like protein/nitrogen-specific signal transduction histidine kinase
MCYTCVRECPVKAIRITDGQAKVIAERCIACGNCVRICSQNAKLLRSTVDEVWALLRSGQPVAACVAPSFPAEFADLHYEYLVGGLRELGFQQVVEVSFGADLVAREYARLFERDDGRRYISTTCPAIVRYVERHSPELVGSLAPIVSPMVAMSRALRQLHGDDLRIVFIGPCVAKKLEATDPELGGDIDGVLMFPELRQMWNEAGIDADHATPSEFDPPHGGVGGLFPVSRGILQAANLHEDLMTGEVVATGGRNHMVEAIKEFGSGDLGARLLEVLCCDGCISGPGMSSQLTLFHRRRHVRTYVVDRMDHLDRERWSADMERLDSLDLRREYEAHDQRMATPAPGELEHIMHRMGKYKPSDELNCGACGYETCLEHASAIHMNLAECEMCLPNTIDQLRMAIKEVEASHGQLAATQEALVHSEKLASMGQLAAGIAHEVNNPLGVVLMYSHLMLNECERSSVMHEDLAMIAEQADRCKRIVSGLLHFARQNKVDRASHDLPRLVEHALRTMVVPENVVTTLDDQMTNPVADIDRDQIIQVLTNLVSNSAGAMPDGGTITVRTSDDADHVRFAVHDTGTGIAPENLKKIFDPFFTTKPMGMGTGLGLAVTYGIVKMHSGDIQVESQADPERGPTGTTFTVTLPRRE